MITVLPIFSVNYLSSKVLMFLLLHLSTVHVNHFLNGEDYYEMTTVRVYLDNNNYLKLAIISFNNSIKIIVYSGL